MARVRLVARNRPDREIAFEINGADPDFFIGTERISGWNLGDVDDRLLDLLDVAGAVFAADGMVTRGGLSRPHFGASWRRDLLLEIAVRDPEFWGRKDVGDALIEAVEFLTDDRVEFAFGRSPSSAPAERYLQFTDRRDLQGATSDEPRVVLFSGGLDSLAGALETLRTERGRVILVTHRAAPKIIARQDLLARELQDRYGARVSYVPIRATYRGRTASERTQRSRSFLFAAFGYVIARTVGATRLDFFENGVVSHNLPLSPQIIGTMATRTTHPYALLKFEALLTLIGENRFTVGNRFEWLTKADIVGRLGEFGASGLIATAVSCNHVYDRSKEQTHCGACSQCLDRRFGVLAAGLEAHEPDDIYETPVLTGERPQLRSRTIASEWTRHAMRLADMSLEQFQEAYAGDIARIARGMPAMRTTEALRRCFELQQRHGKAVRDVLTTAAQAHARHLVTGALPATSLLRALVADANRDPSLASVARPSLHTDLTASIDWPDDGTTADRMIVAMTGNGSGRRLEVKNLGSVEGAPAGPAFALRPHYLGDSAKGLSPDDHRYVPAGRLVPGGGPSKSAVTQNVKRCRAELTAAYKELHGRAPQGDLLIQNRRNSGYRLDPTILLVDAPENDELSG